MKLKKICILLAMLCAVTACEDKKQTPEPEIIPEIEILGYRPAEIRLTDNFERIISLDMNVGDVYIFGQLKTGGYSGYITDGTFREYTSFSFIPQKNETIISSAVLTFGKKAVLTNLDGMTMLYIYGTDGVQEKAIECPEIPAGEENIRIISCGRDSYVINVNNQRLVHMNNGGYVGDIDLKGDILGFSRGEDNTVSYFTADSINSISFDNSKTNVSVKNVKISSAPYAVCIGEKGYTGVFEDGIYSISDKTEKVIDFTNMNFKPSDVTDIIEIDNGYAVVANGEAYFITEDDITELSAEKTIWIGSNVGNYHWSLMERYAEKYSENHDCTVAFRDYPSENALVADVISGNAPDIIPLGYTPLESYGNYDELFADMYTFLDKDSELSREDFLPNILAGLEHNGKLCQLGTSFRVRANATDDERIPENWTVDDMIEIYENLGENETLFPVGQYRFRDQFFRLFFDSSMYIDYENSECFFDSPDFVKYLEFFQKNEIGITYPEFEEAGEVFTPISVEEYGKKQLVHTCNDIYSPSDLYQYVKGEFNGKMNFVGAVGDGENSGISLDIQSLYAISASSPNIDDAWDFFKTIFFDIDTGNTHYATNFPVIETEFDKAMEKYTRNNAYVDYDTGKTVIEKWTYCDKEIECFTPEECEYYKDKITSARVLNKDSSIENIICSEASNYFDTDGDAEKTAETIQQKVSEYLKTMHNS